MESVDTKRRYLDPAILLIIAVCVVSRLPQLFSANLLLDGDECVVGLMAKHMYQGKDLSVYFYGQAYGFSLIETSFISVFYFLNGINEYSIKLAMLTLWTIGVVFFYRTMVSLAPPKSCLPLCTISLFVISPVWAEWSMKARGGYLTSFTLSSVITWILFSKPVDNKPLLFLLVGSLLTVVYESQPLWLVALLPFVAYKLYGAFKFKLGYLLAGMIVTEIPFLVIKHFTSHYWNQQIFNWNYHTCIRNLRHLPMAIVHHFQGWYYLWTIFKSPTSCSVYAGMFVGVMLLLLVAAVYFIATDYKSNLLFLLSILPIFFCIGYYSFLKVYSPRYLLPLSGAICFSAFLLAGKLGHPRIFYGVCIAFLIPGIPALFSFRHFKVNTTRNDMSSVIRIAEDGGYHHFFSREATTQWLIMFYSDERLTVRYTSLIDRYPKYLQMVDEALTRGDKTAVIGTKPLPELPGARVIQSEGFVLYPNVDKATLEKLGFEF